MVGAMKRRLIARGVSYNNLRYMRTLFIIPFLLFPLFLLAQEECQGRITNSESGDPIPYVNVGIINKDKGTVSNPDGEFSFELPSELNGDSIKFSSIGFEPKTFLVSEFLQLRDSNETIQLTPLVTQLDEVVVTGEKMKEKILGSKTKSRSLRGGFRGATLGHEVGIKIKIKDSPTYIKKFHTNVLSNTNLDGKYRLNFYSIKDGVPHEKIVTQNIFFSIDVKEGEFTFDLSEYNIVVHEDFYCTIELIENLRPEDEVFFSAGLLGKTLAYRNTSQGEWRKTGAVSLGLNFTVKY